MRQVVTAVADGAIASLEAEKYVAHEIIPRGNTELLAGDYLVILLKESIASSVQEELILHCNKITI